MIITSLLTASFTTSYNLTCEVSPYSIYLVFITLLLTASLTKHILVTIFLFTLVIPSLIPSLIANTHTTSYSSQPFRLGPEKGKVSTELLAKIQPATSLVLRGFDPPTVLSLTENLHIAENRTQITQTFWVNTSRVEQKI